MRVFLGGKLNDARSRRGSVVRHDFGQSSPGIIAAASHPSPSPSSRRSIGNFRGPRETSKPPSGRFPSEHLELHLIRLVLFFRIPNTCVRFLSPVHPLPVGPTESIPPRILRNDTISHPPGRNKKRKRIGRLTRFFPEHNLASSCRAFGGCRGSGTSLFAVEREPVPSSPTVCQRESQFRAGRRRSRVHSW